VGQITTGRGAVAIGDPNTANGTGTVALGADNVAASNAAGTVGADGAVAIGNANSALGQGSVAIGNSTDALGVGSVALGNDATATNARDVALGSGSVTAAPNTGAFTINGGTVAGATSNGVVSAGDAINKRQIQNVAAGVVSATSTDAINGSQLYLTELATNNLGDSVETLIGGGTALNTDGTIATNPSITAAGSTHSNVTTAIQALNTANTTTNNGLASALGGGASVAANGAVTAPSYTVDGSTYGNVGDALTALEAAAQYPVVSGNASALAASTAAGADALAVGFGNTASGISAIAMGVGITAAGANSVAIGSDGTAANGAGSVAIGQGQTATGRGAVAIGDPNIATGTGAVALGADNTATGDGAVAIGNLNQATQNGAVALGNGAVASNTNSVAIGTATTASGFESFAAGRNSTASGTDSIAIGNTAQAQGLQSTAMGINSQAANLNATALGNAAKAIADNTTAIGTSSSASGAQASALGNISNASGTNASALGVASSATADNTTAVGGFSSATAAQAVAVGNTANASGSNASALGYGSVASNFAATAIGQSSVAGQAFATALGSDAKANGFNATALGAGAVASQAGSVALGNGSTTTAPHAGAFTLNGGTAAATAPTSVVSVGAAGAERQITNVAAGVVSATSTDAINGSQLFTTATAVNNLGDSLETVTGGGLVINPDGTIATPPTINAAGSTFANTTAAIEALNTGNNTSNTGIANAIGGGMTIAANGTVTAPTLPVNGTNYSNVADALAAAGAGFNFTTGATGTGVANGSSVSAIGAGETHTVTAGDNIITTQAGNDVAIALNPVLTGITSLAVTGGPAISATGINMNGDTITGLAVGSTAAGSTEAVNGGQLNTGLASVATNLGGGSTYNPVTGTVTAPAYTIQGSTYNDVGSALGVVDSNLTNVLNGTAGLVQQVGGSPGAGQITVGATTGGTSVSFAGTSGNRTLTDVAAGAITATSDDAVNGSQLFANNHQVANLLGGGAGVDPLTGALTAPNYTVGGTTLGDVGSAIAALQSGAPVQYSTAGAPTTPNGLVPSQNMTLVGAAAGPVTLSNVGPASLTATSTDAVNGSQINTLASSNATIIGGGSVFDPVTGTLTAPTFTVAGGTQNNVGDALGALNTANNTANTGISNVIGGGMAVGPDGAVTNPSFNVNGSTYGTVADALAAAGGGFNLTTAATGTGTALSSSVSQVGAGETATVTAGNNIVTTQIGNEVQIALNSNLTGIDSITLNNGSITGLAAGSTAAGSTDAVNGGQINTGLGSVATNLGGGSSYNPTIGTVTAPTYTVQGNTYNNVGSALGGVDAAINNLTNGTAGLVQQTGGAPGSGPITVGANTGGTVVNVAGTAGNRTVTGVAPAALTAASTDAVNGSQVNALATSVATNLGGGSTFNPATGTVSAPSYTVGGTTVNSVGAAITQLQTGSPLQYSTAAAPTTANGLVPSQNVTLVGAAAGPVTLDNVAPASTAAGSTQAVNGGQLNTGLASVASGLGGGSTYNPVTGQVTAPSYTVSGATYGNVGDALAASNRNAVQYVPDAAGNPTNAVRLSGNGNGQPVAVTNVAAGAVTATSLDAVNGGQLFAVQQTAAGAVQYDRNTDGSLHRSSVTFGTPGTPVQLRNVANGTLAGDVANIGQLQAGLASGLASANTYTDGRITALSFDLGKVAKRSYAGTASALALQSPALFEPGQTAMRGGVGYYRGEWALGLSVRATADNGRWSLTGGISGGPNSGVAASAGIDFVLGN
jgi:trimeric autotransporter adhesin